MPDIRAYAGVCGLWRVAALPYLYRSVWLRSMKNLKKLSSILDGDPSIAKYIRRVQLRGTRRDEQDHWMYAFPSAIKTHLPALRILDIRHVDIVSARILDPGDVPVFIVTCRTQEVHVYRNAKTNELAAGMEDKVQLVTYAIGVTRIPEDVNNPETRGWRLIELQKSGRDYI